MTTIFRHSVHCTAFALLCAFGMHNRCTADDNLLSELDGLSASQQVERLCEQLTKQTEALAEKCVDFKVTQTGLFLLAKHVPRDDTTSPSPNEVTTEFSQSTKRQKLRLVSSKTAAFAELMIGDSPTTIWYDGKETQTLSILDSLPTQVSIQCAGPIAPTELLAFLHQLDHSCWRGARSFVKEKSADIHDFCDMIRGLKFSSSIFEENAKYGQVLELYSDYDDTGEFRDDPLSTRKLTCRFGEFQGQIVYLGMDVKTRCSLPGMNQIQGTISRGTVDYQEVDGYVVPVQWTSKLITEAFDLSMTPLMQPTTVKDLTFRVTDCKITDEFPRELFNVRIPAGTKIIDECQSNRKIAAVAKAQESGRSWWWLVGGFVALAAGGSAWRWARTQR